MVFFCVTRKMNIRRKLARRVEDNDVNEKICPQVEQVPQGAQGVKGD